MFWVKFRFGVLLVRFTAEEKEARISNYYMPFGICRFTAEERESRNPYYYMPFGVGPRNCVGMRLALTELKMATVSILQTLKFVVCPETQVCDILGLYYHWLLTHTF